MKEISKICICGGGGLGHTCSAILSSHQGIEVMMYTQHPESWEEKFIVNDLNGKQYEGHIVKFSDQAQHVVPLADLVLLCLPAYLVESTLLTIKPFLSPKTIVGSVVGNTGFFLFAHEIFANNPPGLFAFQRVPYISRVIEYGKKASLLGYKNELLMAVENIPDSMEFCKTVSSLFYTPTKLVDSFYEVTLSNSNPILHTSRLYSMWGDWQGETYHKNPLFYQEWTDDASQILLEMDDEFFVLLDILGVSKKYIHTVLEHYEAYDATSLTKKLRSIRAFATIQSPMKHTPEGWLPDTTSRYFTEDFLFGLRFIYEIAHCNNVFCPMIDKVYHWGMVLLTKSKCF